MPNHTKIAAALVAFFCCLPLGPSAAMSSPDAAPGAPPPSEAAPAPSAGDKAVDALVVRPLSFLMSIFSAGAFVASAPFIPLDSGTGFADSRKQLVDYPFQYTFTRPLGDFGGPSTPGWSGESR
jgi:hypothetical protein